MQQSQKSCICYLVHGGGMVPMLDNSFTSLRRVNPRVDVFLYCSENSVAQYEAICRRHNVALRHLKVASSVGQKDYVEYGSSSFNTITTYKWPIMLDCLAAGYNVVIYSDADIVVLRDYVGFIERAAKFYGFGVQSESLASFPATCCLGFMFATQGSVDVLKQLDNITRANVADGCDQDIFNRLYQSNPDFMRQVYILPEALFQNGLHFSNYRGVESAHVHDRLKPYAFHANFVLGLPGKVELLRECGLWFTAES